MSSVVISGDTSGTITLQAPAVSGSTTINLPASSGTAVVNGVNGVLVSDTVKASTSGANVDFTSIPSWAKKIIVMFNGVSTTGTSTPILQLGTASSFESSGYVATAARINNGVGIAAAAYTAGFGFDTAWGATTTLNGSYILTLLDAATNTWVAQGNFSGGSTLMQLGSGSKALGGTLTRVRVTTSGGTDTFDAGSINILYE